METPSLTDTSAGYKLLKQAPESTGDSVWDGKAKEYAELPFNNNIFRITKELLYEIIEKHIEPRFAKERPIDVLDFNCGCGNDFPYFLKKGWRVAGCDGSPDMLKQAWGRFADAIHGNQLNLYLGNAENLSKDSFNGQHFDFIFSTTGGFSYVNNTELLREHQVLVNMLKPGGRMLIAHLTPFCPAESLYSLLKGKPRKAFRRWKKTLKVNVNGKFQTMYLRTYRDIKKLMRKQMEIELAFPLLSFTPPYQSGYNPSEKLSKWHKKTEKKLLKFSPGLYTADQVAFVISQKRSNHE